MYEVILTLINEKKYFTIKELKELKIILEKYKKYKEIEVKKRNDK